MYAFRIPRMRERMFNQITRDKRELREQLARLGHRSLRPLDIAWNYVIFYNEKIRQLWAECDRRSPEERARVLREIANLNQKRYQQLEDVGQLPDCSVMYWEFNGFVMAEYNEVLLALEAEKIEQSQPPEQPETVDKPQMVVAQTACYSPGCLEVVDDDDDNSLFGDTNHQVDLISSPQNAVEEADDNDKESLFGDSDYQLHLTQGTQHNVEEDEDNDEESLFGDSDYQLHLTQGNQHNVEEDEDNDEESLFGDSDYQLHLAQGARHNVEENFSSEQQAVEGQAEGIHCRFYEDHGSLFGDERGHVTEMDPPPTQQPGVASDQGSGVGIQMPEQLGLDAHAVSDAEPVQLAPLDPLDIILDPLDPLDLQVDTDESDEDNKKPAAPKFIPGVYYRDWPYWETIFSIVDKKALAWMMKVARKEFRRLWPDGKQDFSERQLLLYATGTRRYKKYFRKNYVRCQRQGKTYFIGFQDEYDGCPPNMELTIIYNGCANFRCIQEKVETKPEVVDLTGDDPTSPVAAAPVGVPEPGLAPPAEIVAADEPVPASMDGEGVRDGPKAPKKTQKRAKKVDKIPTPAPVDQATFTQGSVPATGNHKPTTPPENNGTWSSDWSGRAFTSGGKPPRTPSDKEVVVMERSVSSDNSMRKTASPESSVGTEKARTEARTGAGLGSSSPTKRAHAALQEQLSQPDQTTGNADTPAPANHGPVTDTVTTETAERGNKRQKKNGKAAADADKSHGVSAPEQEPAQYYEPSPEQRVDAKKWVEDHTKGGKGKKSQKRKSPQPKVTPPRKAGKTTRDTPTAPRVYRNIAPAPPRNDERSNDAQLPPRAGTSVGTSAGTSMGNEGTTPSSPEVQITGIGPLMQQTRPQMPHGRPQQTPLGMIQQSFQNAPRPQYFHPPTGPRDEWANPMQQQSDWEAANSSFEERQMRLEQQLRELKQEKLMADKDREIAELKQRLSQQHPVELPQMTSSHAMPQGYWPPPQQGHAHQQSHGKNNNVREEYLPFQQFQQFPQQMPQAPMATPQMMPNQAVPLNGMAPYPTNMHGGYWPASPAAGHPMDSLHNGYPATPSFPQNGYPTPMDFSQGVQGANAHGMHGGFNRGAGGNHMEKSMHNFGF
jgi:hypothetical protein